MSAMERPQKTSKRMPLFYVVSAAICFTALLLVGCPSNNNDDPNTIVIVSSLPRTGSAKGQTDTMVNGIKMAIEEYEGKLGGLKIVYKDLDDAEASSGQWTASAETANAQSAANDKNVMAYIGPYNSGAASVSIPINNKAGLVMVSPAATWTGLTKKPAPKSQEPEIYQPTGKVNFVRVVPTDDLQGPIGARFIAQTLKKKNVFILDDNERYGEGVAGEFEKGCEKFGLKVLGHEKINVQQQEYSGLMTQISRASNGEPDAIYFGGTTQSKGGQIAKDMIKAFKNCVLVVPDGCYEKAFIESAGSGIEGRIFVSFGGKDPSKLTGSGKKFFDDYKKKYNDTDPEAYAVYGYEAAKVVLEAIKKVGKKDRAAILEAIVTTKDFDQGAIGKWSFDQNGDTTQQIFTISEIKNGKFSPVTELNGIEDPKDTKN
jgi:branched-chain amino acid transport system substrate-binding protein